MANTAKPKFTPEDIPTPDELANSDQVQREKEIVEFLQEVKKALESGGRHVFSDGSLSLSSMRTIQDILRARDWECEWDLHDSVQLATLSPVPQSGTIRELPKRGLFKRWKRQRYEIYNGQRWLPYKPRR